MNISSAIEKHLCNMQAIMLRLFIGGHESWLMLSVSYINYWYFEMRVAVIPRIWHDFDGLFEIMQAFRIQLIVKIVDT